MRGINFVPKRGSFTSLSVLASKSWLDDLRKHSPFHCVITPTLPSSPCKTKRLVIAASYTELTMASCVCVSGGRSHGWGRGGEREIARGNNYLGGYQAIS
ncbi:hypothetical protein J6590_003346 [Homalodisca vitripennis]|nr:hypothetical protein J6590_003346 [Homalodisca vitripennis]